MITIGCDIHVHIEVKMEGEWRHYSNPHVERNYRLFSLMADVRNYKDLEPISQPKGLPSDVTYLTRVDHEHWGVDVHDESYLTIGELIELKYRWKKLNHKNPMNEFLEIVFHTYVFSRGITGWYEYPSDNHMDIEDLRIVFWFDN